MIQKGIAPNINDTLRCFTSFLLDVEIIKERPGTWNIRILTFVLPYLIRDMARDVRISYAAFFCFIMVLRASKQRISASTTRSTAMMVRATLQPKSGQAPEVRAVTFLITV